MDYRDGENEPVNQLYDQFISAGTCKAILSTFHQLIDILELKHVSHRQFYRRLRSRITSWKAQSLWARIDKRASLKEYKKGEACANTRVLIIGAGPCGLRTAIELAFLGAKCVIVEKRDSFSRNNVLHLWPYLITDLKNLGAKKFFGKFCAGAIDHISIRQLQCILMKVALLLGVEIDVNVSFEGLIEPTENTKTGWKCKVLPEDHPVSEYEFDVLVGADGKRNTLEGFKRKEFRGKLAIAITANFINRNTQAEARVEEISGVAFIFNQKFFKDLNAKSGIDLENIVYYKDDTHYFVMTAKKWSLLDRGVLRQDFADTAKLLHPQNIDRAALQLYAKDAANFSTNFLLPDVEFAINHYGQPDVAMFDFTSMFAALNASRVVEKHGHKLIVTLVGDSLLEPFWPTGSGCARGFLGAFDAAWMVRMWASGKMTPLQVIAQRESIYQLLSQTTPERLSRNYNEYTIDPNTRYQDLNLNVIKPEQVRHLYDCGDVAYVDEVVDIPVKRIRNDETMIDSYTILRWCQRLLNTGKFKNVQVSDLTYSWKNGMALCALIHCFKPELINLDNLCPGDVAENNQLAFDIAQKELGISPVMTGQDMANCDAPDKLTMMSYLSYFFQKFRKERTPSDPEKVKERQKSHRSPHHRLSILQKLRSSRFIKSKKKKEEEKNEFNLQLNKPKYRDITMQNGNIPSSKYKKLPMDEIANKFTGVQDDESSKGNKEDVQIKVKVSEMAEILVSKFKTTAEAPPPPPSAKKKPPGILLGAQPASEICFFCKKRVYLMERMNAEGVFFHRGCLKCDFCETGLRLNNYSCERTPGTGQVKFYCFRHNRPDLRVTSKIKRRRIYYEEDETSKENMPKIVIETILSGKQSPEKRSDGSPKKRPTPLTPPLAPPVDFLDKRTPERIEFENSIDGLPEESEEELTEHNLRASLSSDVILDEVYSSDSDLESNDEEELQEVVNETFGCNKDLTLEDALKVVETLKRKSHENLLEAMTHEHHHNRQMEVEKDEDDENTEVEEMEEDASEYDSDGEEGTEEEVDYDNGDVVMSNKNSSKPGDDLNKGDIDNGQQSSTADQQNSSNTTSSPSVLKSARANFFVSPAEVVRIDPFKMFGMGKKIDEDKKVESDKVFSEDNLEVNESETENTDNQVKEHVLDDGGSGSSFKEVVNSDQDTDMDEEVEDVFHESSEEAELERTAMHEQMKLLLEKSEPIDDGVDSDQDDVFMGDRIETDDIQPSGEVIHGESVGAIEEPEDQTIERSFDNLDDRFVTRTRRGGMRRKKLKRSSKRNSFGSDSSFTISTPSLSQGSSLSSISVEDSNQPLQYEGDGEDDDIKPDEDMLKDYQLTLSQALGENYSDNENENSPRDEQDVTLDDTINAAEQDSSENRNSSVYLTPEASLTEQWMSQSKAVTSDGDKNKLESGVSDKQAPCDKLFDVSKKTDIPSQDYTGFTWRPLPPLPDEKEKSKGGSVAQKSSDNKMDIKRDRILSSDKQEGNRKLPDISNLTSNINPDGFQSKFMRSKIGSPTSSHKTTDTDSTKESSSSPEIKKSKVLQNNISSVNKVSKVLSKSENNSNKKMSSDKALSSSGKTKISVDHAKLRSVNSIDNDSSSQNEGLLGKKKIGVDANLKNRVKPKPHSERVSVGENINDIPFADDSDGEFLEKEMFFTPVAPSAVKSKAKKDIKTPGQKDVKKRLLPTPPKQSDLPPTPSAQHIRDLKKSEMESARVKARQKARLKSDEELGLENMDYTPIISDKRNKFFRTNRAQSTPSASDVVSDSSDLNNLKLTPVLSEQSLTPKERKKKKKDKEKIGTPKGSDMSDSDSKSSPKKKKSFLQMFKPLKALDKSKDWKDKGSRSSSQDTLDEKSEKKKKKIPKSDKKKKKSKSVSSAEKVDVALSDNLKDLKIGAMFQSKEKGRLYKPNALARRPGHAVRKKIPPKAEMDEFSDSGESFHSTDTLSKRKERRTLSESELNVRIARRVQSAARKQQKQREQKRLRMAQEIQRQLQEVDVKQRELEERGVIVEKALRGEGPDAGRPEAELMQEWFNLVYEKNALVRYESELMVNAQYMELEDRHGRLEQQLRERMVTDNKGKQDNAEKRILDELLQVVEERDNLILMLEEDRLREQEEDKDLRAMMLAKGFDLSPMDHTRKLKDSSGFPLSC